MLKSEQRLLDLLRQRAEGRKVMQVRLLLLELFPQLLNRIIVR